MPEEHVISPEQMVRLQERLDDVKEELHREEKTAVPDIGEGSYLQIAQDEMAAFLSLNAPPEANTGYEVKNILAYIKEQGVVFNCDEAKIAQMVKERLYHVEIEIAAGKEPVEGKDGWYEYNFDVEGHRAPKERPDGSVDYTSIHQIHNVKAGDVLATYHHAIQGEEGYTVTGKPIKPVIAKEQRPLRGRNISNQEDPDVYVSLIDGKVEMKDGRMDIQNTHEIQGDVDLIVGKIEFFGDIVINGNVEAGVMLRAGRNIIVRGTAEAVTMFAGGDITLERGVQGGQKAKLSARGSVFADFIEHCVVDAGGDVKANAIMNSTVSAGGKVILTGKRGRIIGGYIHGMKGICVVSAGNMSEIHTVIHAGFEEKTYEELLRLVQQEKETSEVLREVLGEMSEIIKNRKQPTYSGSPLKMQEVRLPALNAKKDELFAKLDKIRSDKEFTQALMEKGRGAKIEVNGTVYRGVVICIDNVQMPIEENNSYMSYQNKGGIIEQTVVPYKQI